MISYFFKKEFLKFLVVGLLNAVVTFGSFYIFYRIFHLYYLFSSIIAYSLGITNSFLWNKNWTFQAKNQNNRVLLIKFFILNFFGLLLNTVFMKIFVEISFLEPTLAQVMVIGIVVGINFLGSKLWVFKKA